ncbi:MAG: VOC family protein, partial [Novosphingobium sp.]
SGFVTGDMGMGHAVFATPNFDEAHAFYKAIGFHDTDIPRFRFSDDPNDPGMGFAFMHADNGRHHSVAIAEMPVPPSACIHLMLEMKTQSDVGKCYDRMRLNKVPESASIGRHVNDQTFGFYMQTPSGFDIEIGADPLVIDPTNWTPTAHLIPSEWGHVWAWQKALEEQAGEQA